MSAESVAPSPQPREEDARFATLAAIEQRLLWLAVRIVDFANRDRPASDGLKVGGHQASSASVVTIMTALYFHALRAGDRVSVKPHAAPVLHAIEYLLGRLPQRYLTTLRDFGGLQAYPSRTKDPFPVDYSTGSVGLGAAAPVFGALADRYVDDHVAPGPCGRFVSLLGDAELDEGNIWEAVFEPQLADLERVLWIVDLNRQSLDRVIPTARSRDLAERFAAAGWSVIELRYGEPLRRAFALPDGHLLRGALDRLPNDAYQRLLVGDDDTVADVLLDAVAVSDRPALARVLVAVDRPLGALVRSLGGHDLGDVVDAVARADAIDAPTVILASTIKGYGLPFAAHPGNHSALLGQAQIGELRASLGLTLETEWDRFPDGSPEDAACRGAAERLARAPAPNAAPIAIPERVGARAAARTSTQEAFGRLLLDLARIEGVAERLVTVSPDVSVSTNLGGWINKVGLYAHAAGDDDAGAEDADPLRWRPGPSGRHIELGISEMNLFLLLGQLGLTAAHRGERLLPVGTVYDPFVLRGLEGLLYSVYNDARFVVAGTPSGITLSREGGAHQSTITPGVGVELPGITYAEPTYGRELEWHLLDGLRRLQERDGESLYLRLSTRTIDQAPFAELVERRGDAAVRADVLAGGYRLRDAGRFDDRVVLVACGALVPEALEAAALLEAEEGVGAAVVVASSPDLLYRDWRNARLGPLEKLTAGRRRSHLEELLAPDDPAAPIVTVLDGASHALAFVGACLGRATVPLGVDRFGQTGSLAAVYEEYRISAESVVLAALIALEEAVQSR